MAHTHSELFDYWYSFSYINILTIKLNQCLLCPPATTREIIEFFFVVSLYSLPLCLTLSLTFLLIFDIKVYTAATTTQLTVLFPFFFICAKSGPPD
jgi:hypothetical protein